MDLREYEQSKFAIAEILREVSHFVPEGRAGWREHLQGLFARLAEDRFNLVVVGRFSRGKTSLMNAILGTDRLPTGIAPLTSVITAVSYGSKEQAILTYENRILNKEVPIEALPSYITQQGNPGNVQRIKTAEIQLPAEILRRGFYFVDTPGLGSVIAENTLTTEAFLAEADAFILVTSYESPLSEDEMRFFKAGLSSGRRIFVVLNKHDTVSIDDRNAALAFVREQLEDLFGHQAPQVFSVSSTDAVQAKRSSDLLRLASSGIPALEDELIRFLLTEKSGEFLLRTCERVRNLLRELPESDATENLTRKLGIFAGQLVDAHPSATLAEAEGRPGPLSDLHRLQSCEICADIAEKTWQFLCRYQYEIASNADEQQRFAQRGGFCPFHTWEYQSIVSPYGICNGYPGLLDQLTAELRDAMSPSVPREALIKKIEFLLPQRDDCVLCSVRDRAEHEAISVFVERLDRDQSGALDSFSACLPHFTMLVAAIQNDDAVRALIDRQAAVLQRFSEDMRRYALKHDAVRRHLASQEESTVAQRALLSAAGRRRVNFLPRQTGVARTYQIR
jgi:small GTP-binding protein